MKGVFITAAAAALVALGGCASTHSGLTHYAFPFSHDNVDYEIISVVVSSDGGHNFLTSRSGNQLVLSAKDVDQDGTLDTVLIGDVPLDSANYIYHTGIDLARNMGKYREQRGTRIYQYHEAGFTYTVQTFTPDAGDLYNTFQHLDYRGIETVSIDEDADGHLDRIKEGPGQLEAIQLLYEEALKEGIRTGRVIVIDGRYAVKVVS